MVRRHITHRAGNHNIFIINYISYAPKGRGENVEVVDLSRIYLNDWAACIARIFSITVLLGATIAYWILMANFLYNSVNFIYGMVKFLDLNARENACAIYTVSENKICTCASFF